MPRYIFALFFFSLCCTTAEAQLNFYAGYRLGFTNPEAFNAIVEEHNAAVKSDPIIGYRDTIGFDELRYLNGVDLGISYGFAGGRVQFGWMNKRKQIRADGQRIGSSSQFENRITTTINNLNIGYYPTFGPVYLGATLDYNFLRIKTDFEEVGQLGVPGTQEAYSNAWSSHFSFGYDLSNGGNIGLKIEPYIQLYWSDYDLGNFYKIATGDESANPEIETKEQFATFGISFIVYNGPQRR